MKKNDKLVFKIAFVISVLGMCLASYSIALSLS